MEQRTICPVHSVEVTLMSTINISIIPWFVGLEVCNPANSASVVLTYLIMGT